MYYMKDFQLDDTYCKAVAELNKLEERLRYSKCEVTKFVLLGEIDNAKLVLEKNANVPNENVNRFFDACTSLGIKKICVFSRELVTCDDCRYGDWPAVWELSSRCGLPSSCGNRNQRQISIKKGLFPYEFIDKAYDVRSRRRIDVTPFMDYAVVSRPNGWFKPGCD